MPPAPRNGSRADPPAAPLPIDEAGRLVAVARVRSGIDEGEQDPQLEEVVRVARAMLDVPMAQVTCLDAGRELLLAGVGGEPAAQARRDAFSAHAILGPDPLVVPDAAADARFRANPLVVGPSGVRAWVGAPIVSADGHSLGTVCGLDVRPRDWTPAQVQGLQALAELVATHLEGQSVARRLVSYALDDLEVGEGSDAEIAEVLAHAARVVVDHEAWPLAWGHASVDGEFQVVGPVGIDPTDLDTGLALYELRHRFQERRDGATPFRLGLDEVPSSIAAIGARTGVAELLVVPVEVAPKVTCWLVFGSTSRRGAEAMLLRQLGTLAARIASEVRFARETATRNERPRVLDVHAVDRLRAIDDLRHRVQVGLSHHLRTPLTLVTGVAELLRTRPEVAKERPDLVEALVRHAATLTDLVDDLLAVTAAEQGPRAVDPLEDHTIDVTELVATTARRAVAGASSPASLTLRLTPVRARVDPTRLERAVRAMVENALQHTPDGTAVEIGLRSAGRDRFEVLIADDGPGIPPELRERIFLPFEQGQDTDPATPGVGVGLGLVAACAAVHGGRCWVDERPGGGARFHLELPQRLLVGLAPPGAEPRDELREAPRLREIAERLGPEVS